MNKIGRNDTCTCGSGKKYKKCCLPLPQENRAVAARPASLTRALSVLQAASATGKETFATLGVFILFSTAKGDAWLLEATEMDAVQVASGGETITVEIEESPGTLAVNWTHCFAVRANSLVLTAYEDQDKSRLPNCPLQQIKAAVKAIQTHASPTLLQSIHLGGQEKPPQMTPSH